MTWVIYCFIYVVIGLIANQKKEVDFKKYPWNIPPFKFDKTLLLQYF